MTYFLTLTCSVAAFLVAYADGLAAVAKRNPPLPYVDGYNYKGCYQDALGNGRRLSIYMGSGALMNLETCATICKDYQYFGVEATVQCFCDNTLNGVAAPVSESECDTSCPGNSNQKCGASFRANIFQKKAGTAISFPAMPLRVPYGCYTTINGDSIFAAAEFNFPSGLTIQACEAICAPFSYYSLKAGSKCQCGDSIKPNLVKQLDSSCNTPCNGDASQTCGGTDLTYIYGGRDTCGNLLTNYLVRNPGFENSVSSWATTTSQPGLIQWTTPASQPYKGRRSARIVSKSLGASITMSQTIRLCPTQSYSLSLYTKHEPDSSCTATVKIDGILQVTAFSTTAYTETSSIFSPQGAMTELAITVECGGTRALRIVYIDNVQINPIY